MLGVRAGARIPHRPPPSNLVELLVVGASGIEDTSVYERALTNNGCGSNNAVPYLGANTVGLPGGASIGIYSPALTIPGDFCIECFAFVSSFSGGQQCCLFSSRSSSSDGVILYIGTTAVIQGLIAVAGSVDPTGFPAFSLDEWHHVALDRQDTTLCLGVDGEIMSRILNVHSGPITTAGAVWGPGAEINIGSSINSGAFRQSNLRVTFASRYQSDYEVPTPPLSNTYP